MKGANAGKLVQRGQSYYPTLKLALMNVRERLRALEYASMEGPSVDYLIQAIREADQKMEQLIKETF